jgi:hypothetical protein
MSRKIKLATTLTTQIKSKSNQTPQNLQRLVYWCFIPGRHLQREHECTAVGFDAAMEIRPLM